MADTNTQTSDNNSLLTLAPNIFAFFGIIAAVFFSLDPLESPRPDAASSHNQQFASDTEVYSRPWEDPFDLPEEKPTGAVNYGSGSSTTTNSSETSDGDLVCLVSLSAAPWSDWVEIRRRARYAIVSALLNAQYISTNPGVVQVHYFSSDIGTLLDFPERTPTNPKASSAEKDAGKDAPAEDLRKLTTEEFTSTSLLAQQQNNLGNRNQLGDLRRKYNHVVVCYLREELLFSNSSSTDNSITTLNRIRAAIYKGLKLDGTGKHPGPNDKFLFLGPSSSTSYLAMVQHYVARPEAAPEGLWISPWATIADNLIANRIENEADKQNDGVTSTGDWTGNQVLDYEKILSGGMNQKHLRLVRATNTDDEFSRAILEELCNRGLDRDSSVRVGRMESLCNFCSHPKKKIVLLTESDSIYGTAFPTSFMQEVKRGNYDAKVETHTYFSGLDGKTPFGKNEQTEAGDTNGSSTSEEIKENHDKAGASAFYLPNQQEHPPLSRQQYDRVRALAEDLARENREGSLPFPHVHDPIFAVGVVGTDVFDKIVILQALKRVLPEAHFFTTDLDALFTYKPYKGFTQNLLVASSFGFRLTRPCQGRAPPFRDSYQTTIYASLLGALNYYDFSRRLFPDTPNPLRAVDDIPLSPDLWGPDDTKARKAQSLILPPHPQIYEISGRDAHLLDTGTTSSKAFSLNAVIDPPDSGYRDAKTAGLTLLGYLIAEGFHLPAPPYRGTTSSMVDWVCQFMELVALSTLLAQSCCLCMWARKRLIKPILAACNPDTDDEKMPVPTLQIQAIEAISNVVSNAERTVIYPFCLLLFMFLARTRVMDGWALGAAFCIICTLACLALACVAALLRTSFNQLRYRVRRNITNAATHQERVDQKELSHTTLLERVDSINVLNSFWNNPIFGGLAILMTGAGGTQLLAYLYR